MQIKTVLPRVMAFGLIAVSALCIALATEFRDLSRSYDVLRQRSGLPHAGYFMPTFSARTMAGDSVQIGATSGVRHRQLVFVLTTTCPYCRQTLPIWAALADSVRRLSGWTVDVVGISLDSVDVTRTYGETHGVAYPLVTFPSRKLKQLYRARAVPQTLVLDEEGRVLYARTGLLEPAATLDSVYRALQWTRPAPRPKVVTDSSSSSTSAYREPLL